MKFAIIVRGDKYLNLHYKWADLPDLIPLWHAPLMLRVMMGERNPQKPTGIAEVDSSSVIDLDSLGVISL
jgi:hypothetical protein